MRKIKIMTVCGFGLGTSMILRMTLDKVLKKHGISAETFCADEATARGMHCDLILTSKEMMRLFDASVKPVIEIKNFLSQEEIEEKGLPIIRLLASEE